MAKSNQAKTALKGKTPTKAVPAASQRAVTSPIAAKATKAAKQVIPVVVSKKTAAKKVAVPAKKVAVKAVTKPAAKVAPVKKVAVPAKKVVAKAVTTQKKTRTTTQKTAVKAATTRVNQKEIAAAIAVSQEAPITLVGLPKPVNPSPGLAHTYSFPSDVAVEPVFTKHDSVAITRYSDEELNEFRELINEKLKVARQELSYQQSMLKKTDDTGADAGDVRHMDANEREQIAQLASRQVIFINHLEKALIRIENKSYGVCRVTGQLIDKPRLRAVPHATLSIEAKNVEDMPNPGRTSMIPFQRPARMV